MSGEIKISGTSKLLQRRICTTKYRIYHLRSTLFHFIIFHTVKYIIYYFYSVLLYILLQRAIAKMLLIKLNISRIEYFTS